MKLLAWLKKKLKVWKLESQVWTQEIQLDALRQDPDFDAREYVKACLRLKDTKQKLAVIKQGEAA